MIYVCNNICQFYYLVKKNMTRFSVSNHRLAVELLDLCYTGIDRE